MNESKPFWASKTMWANGVALAASLAAGAGLEIGPETQASLVGGVMAVVNIVLRVMTKGPVTAKKD